MTARQLAVAILAPDSRVPGLPSCPYCKGVVRGLLAACPDLECRVRDAADTARVERMCEL